MLLREVAVDKELDIFCLAETWLKSGSAVSCGGFICLNNNCAELDAEKGRGKGGTAIMLANHLLNRVKQVVSGKNHRVTAALIDNQLLLLCVYLPCQAQHGGQKEWDEYAEAARYAFSQTDSRNWREPRRLDGFRICLMGDLNAHIKGYMSAKTDIGGTLVMELAKQAKLLVWNKPGWWTYRAESQKVQSIIDYVWSDQQIELNYTGGSYLSTSHRVLFGKLSLRGPTGSTGGPTGDPTGEPIGDPIELHPNVKNKEAYAQAPCIWKGLSENAKEDKIAKICNQTKSLASCE